VKITRIEMEVDEFIKIQDNPIQRDTVTHAKKAIKNHLNKYHDSHIVVAIGRMVGRKTQWKIDGHTRAYLWLKVGTGSLKAPKTVLVDVYHVKDEQEVIEVYRCFDNKNAVESNADQITGALNYFGFKMHSRIMAKKLGLLNAVTTIDLSLKRFDANKTVLKKLEPYKKEIKVILEQTWGYNLKQINPGTPSCVAAAFFVLIRLYKDDSLGFWSGFNSGKGRSSFKSGRDGSLAAADWIKKARAEKRIMGREETAYSVIALLNAYEFYRRRKKVDRLSFLLKRDLNISPLAQLGKLLKDLGYS